MFKIDKKFLTYFKNLHQVFIYIIDECQLKCEQCIYKPNITFNIGHKEIDYELLKKLLINFKKLGASKLSILGGEPTLYEKLPEIINFSKKIGFDYVRIDTNGLFDAILLKNDYMKLLDEISFSIDGYNQETHDKVRGEGVFEKAISNIKYAKKLGYRVDITACIYDALLEKNSNNDYLMEELIFLAENNNVDRINFHTLIKDGTAIDTWSGNLEVSSIENWLLVYNDILNNVKNGKYKIPVRIPQLFCKKSEFEKNKKYYGFCPTKLGERVLVHPNGIIRICSGLLGTPYGVARYTEDGVFWDNGFTNELQDHKKELTPCTNRSKKDFGDYVPLCFSFKPKQDEYIWKNKINWDNKLKI